MESKGKVVTCRLLCDCSAVQLGHHHIHYVAPSYTSDWCMPRYTCITKMYFSDMSDPPMVASSKASVVSEATCNIMITRTLVCILIIIIVLCQNVYNNQCHQSHYTWFYTISGYIICSQPTSLFSCKPEEVWHAYVTITFSCAHVNISIKFVLSAAYTLVLPFKHFLTTSTQRRSDTVDL